jgi:hypothetical protein
MSEYDIEFTGHDHNGRYYGLSSDAPFEGVTIDESDGTVTFHD